MARSGIHFQRTPREYPKNAIDIERIDKHGTRNSSIVYHAGAAVALAATQHPVRVLGFVGIRGSYAGRFGYTKDLKEEL